MRPSGLWLLFLVLLAVGRAGADTLFLHAGKALKIESLSCGSRVCVAAVSGGEIEIRVGDVQRVEPDEEVDPETAAGPAPGVDGGTNQRGFEAMEAMVASAAHKYALPRSLVRAVARAESAFRPAAISPKGAQGVMQLMPGTARELGVKDAFDPAENIDAGARLLRRLLEKYEGRLAEALAAYNAGPGAVARSGGVPPYRETRGYIRRVVKEFEAGEKKDSGSGIENKR